MLREMSDRGFCWSLPVVVLAAAAFAAAAGGGVAAQAGDFLAGGRGAQVAVGLATRAAGRHGISAQAIVVYLPLLLAAAVVLLYRADSLIRSAAIGLAVGLAASRFRSAGVHPDLAFAALAASLPLSAAMLSRLDVNVGSLTGVITVSLSALTVSTAAALAVHPTTAQVGFGAAGALALGLGCAGAGLSAVWSGERESRFSRLALLTLLTALA